MKGGEFLDKDTYLQLLAENSKTKQHELIVECMDRYQVNNTQDLTLEQLVKFSDNKNFTKECSISLENIKWSE